MIELYEFLLRRDKSTAKEIADKFSWCTRTVYRKINSLSLIVPIVTARGFGGGVYILKEYKEQLLKDLSR